MLLLDVWRHVCKTELSHFLAQRESACLVTYFSFSVDFEICAGSCTNSVHKNVDHTTCSLSFQCLIRAWNVFGSTNHVFVWMKVNSPSSEPRSKKRGSCLSGSDLCTETANTKKELNVGFLVCFFTPAGHCKLCAAVTSTSREKRLVLVARNGEAHKSE